MFGDPELNEAVIITDQSENDRSPLLKLDKSLSQDDSKKKADEVKEEEQIVTERTQIKKSKTVIH